MGLTSYFFIFDSISTILSRVGEVIGWRAAHGGMGEVEVIQGDQSLNKSGDVDLPGLAAGFL